VNGQPDAADWETFRLALAEKLHALGIDPDDLEPFDADEESVAARAEIATWLAEVASVMHEQVRNLTLGDLAPSEEEFAEIDGLEAWWAGVGPPPASDPWGGLPPPAPRFAYLPVAPLVRSRQRPRAPRTRRTRRVRIRTGSRGDPPDDDPDSEPPLVRGRARRGRLGVGRGGS
jgi:hypothetical protein